MKFALPQSYYGHVESMLEHAGENVRRGQQIATVGTANGRYLRICTLKCASSARHSSARVIAQTCAVG